MSLAGIVALLWNLLLTAIVPALVATIAVAYAAGGKTGAGAIDWIADNPDAIGIMLVATGIASLWQAFLQRHDVAAATSKVEAEKAKVEAANARVDTANAKAEWAKTTDAGRLELEQTRAETERQRAAREKDRADTAEARAKSQDATTAEMRESVAKHWAKVLNAERAAKLANDAKEEAVREAETCRAAIVPGLARISASEDAFYRGGGITRHASPVDYST